MRTPNDSRWETTFGKFVRKHSVQRLVFELRSQGFSVTTTAIYYWLRPGGPNPKPKHAKAIVDLSNGELTMEDIYSHQQQIAQLDGVKAPC